MSGFYQGAEVVTSSARDHAEGKFGILFAPVALSYFSHLARLKNSEQFNNELDLAAFTKSFDTGLKMTFSDSSKTQFVKFGSPRDDDACCGVKGGKLSLPG